MKTIVANFKLKTNGLKLSVALMALLRAVGIEGEVSQGEIPGEVLDTLRVQLVRPGVTGAEVLKTDEANECHYVMDGNMLDISLAGLAGGVHRLTVLVQYGTNTHSLLIVDLEVPDNVLYLVAGEVVMPLARMAEKDGELDGVKYYAFAYEYGNQLAWLRDEHPQHLRGTVAAYYAESLEATLEEATELEGARLIQNYPESVYDNIVELTLPGVDTFGAGGGGEYQTDIYMDAAGRVIMERMEDGSTVFFDEHENPIVRRLANGTTQVLDAYQSERILIDANGLITLNGQSEIGQGHTVTGVNAMAQGVQCVASGAASHAEGTATVASGQGSHAEGSSSQDRTCEARGENSHAEGLACQAIGKNSHAEGNNTTSTGINSHAEGNLCESVSYNSHAEGQESKTTGGSSHAEGYQTTASAFCAHAEGNHTTASVAEAHAEGSNTNAAAASSHAEGANTTTSAPSSHAEGIGTNTTGNSSHAEGAYNFPVNVLGAFMHGCGTSDTYRKNAFLIVGSEIYVYGVGGYDGTNHESAQSLREVLMAMA